MALPLKDCRQCSHYRGGYCYGFGTARKVISESEAILCGKFTPLGQVQIGPLDALAGQLKEYQIPTGIISTIKLADAAVTVDKLAASSVINSKVAGDAGIIESKLSLDHGTDALNDLIDANDIDIASNLALILLREETANKDQVNGYLGLDASAKVPLSKLNPLTNSEIAVAAAIAESKLNLAYGTSALNTDIQTREESANKDQASGYLGLDASAKVPLAKLNPLTNTEIDAAAAIVESKLSLAYGTSALNTDIQTREESSNKGAVSGYCGLDVSQLVPLANLSNLTNTQLAAAAAIIESKLSLDHSTQSLFDKVGTDIGTHAGVVDSHHAKYTNAEAVAAVQAVAQLLMSGSVFVPLGERFALNYGDGGNTYITAPHSTYISWFVQNNEILRFYNTGLYVYRDLKVGGGAPGDNTLDIGGAGLRFKDCYLGGSLKDDANSLTIAQIATDLHAQSHTLASHSTKAHSELTGIGASDHHTAYTDAMALAAVDEHLVLESAHATWINCPLEHWSDFANFIMAGDGTLENTGLNESYIYYSVPLPTNRGGKKLRLSGRRLGLADADASNRIRYVFVYGYQNDGTIDQLDLYDIDDMNSVGEHEDSFGPIDCSGYSAIKIRLRSSVLNATQLNIGYVTVRYYYA